MDVDYPAAHSMDTHWFAIDKDGQVGLFFTAETGYLPNEAVNVEAPDLIELATKLGGKAPPGVDEEEEDIEWDEFLEGLVALGFYTYEYIDNFDDPDGLLLPYTLTAAPEAPAHIDQLPPQFRQRYRKVQFSTASFGAADHLQPFDFFPCDTYAEEQVAYLSGDERTLKPVPKREQQYQEFCRENGEQLRASRKGLRIEGLDEKPKPGKRSRKGDKGK
jgi:hypothetical protein